MMQNKKGQFFLIAAVVTIMILFTLTAKYNTIRQSTALQDFKELSEGYTSEQPKVVNLAIAQNQNEAIELNKFTKNYANYAQGKDPNYGVLYAYRDSKGIIHVVNSLGGRAINLQFIGNDGKDATLQLLGTTGQVSGSVNLNIGGQTFGTTVKTDVSNFGENITSTELRNLQKISIKIPGSNYPIQIPLTPDFKVVNYGQSFSCDSAIDDPRTPECEIGDSSTVKATLTAFAIKNQNSKIYTNSCGNICWLINNINSLRMV